MKSESLILLIHPETIQGGSSGGGTRIGRSGAKVWMYSSNKKKEYISAVAREAMQVRGQDAGKREGPINLSITFCLPAPDGAPEDSPAWGYSKDDIDNLLKGTLDGLTRAGLWHDDSQIARIFVEKRYTTHETRIELSVSSVTDECIKRKLPKKK